MSPVTLSLILLSSLCWAIFDATRKNLAKQTAIMPLLCAVVWAQSGIFAIWNVFPGQFRLEAGYYLPSFICFLFNFAANILFIAALRMSRLSMTIPMLSFSPVFSVFASFLLLNEWPSQWQLLGVLLIFMGAFFLSGLHGLFIPGRKSQIDRGTTLMVGVAFLWAVNASLDKISLRYASSATHSLFQCLGIAVCTSIFLVWKGKEVSFRGLAKQKGIFILAMVAAAVALFTQYWWRSKWYWWGFFEALKRACGMILSQFLGRHFFNESFTVHKWIAVAVMTLGVGFLCL